jgi:hypothetical protein
MHCKALVFFCCLLCLVSCKKQTATLSLPQPNDYYPTDSGMVLIYHLDSTLTYNFGATLITKSYLLKDSIGGSFNDNAGCLSYLVYRFITDTLQTQPWQAASTYYITPNASNKDIEVMDDNNLRFIKLKEPVQNDFSWNGNAFIDTKSATSPYQYMDGWNYTYANVNMPFTVLKGTLDSTLTINQVDDGPDADNFDQSNYAERRYSVEVYAKGIGLVYKDFLHWTWQIDPVTGFTSDSYGIRLNLMEVH